MNLYVADPVNNRIWAIGSDHTIRNLLSSSTTLTLHSDVVEPLIVDNPACDTLGASASTDLPASGGTWTLGYSWDLSYNGYTCAGSPSISSDSTWLTISSNEPTCSPATGPDDTVTCTIPYTVSANNGVKRTGHITLQLASGTAIVTIVQYGEPEPLTVTIDGGGAVTGSGVSCLGAGTCSYSFPNGTVLSLSASPASGYTFSGWSGACTGTATCQVTMTGTETVTATFTQIPQETLTVNIIGNGTVSGGSTSIGFVCSLSLCTQAFPLQTVVTLSASSASGYSFSGWSGFCSGTGTGTCTILMTGAEYVTATFAQLPPDFSIAVTNNVPSETAISLGHSASYNVTITSLYGTAVTVVPSITGLPTGVTAQFSTPSITTSGSGVAVLTLTSAYSNSTFIGNSTVTVTGASSTATHSAGFTLVTQPLQYAGYCGVPTTITRFYPNPNFPY